MVDDENEGKADEGGGNLLLSIVQHSHPSKSTRKVLALSAGEGMLDLECLVSVSE